MKKRTLQLKMTTKVVMIALIIGVVGITKGYAEWWNFSAVCPSGISLYYIITDEENHYVELTYPNHHENDGYWEDYELYGNEAIVIPETVEYNGITYTVVSIGEHAFFQCYGSHELILPNTITSIGDYGFGFSSGVYGVLNIPNTVTAIGNYAFGGCSGLTGALIIPNSVNTIGNGAFSGCSGFTGELEIPNTMTSIGVNTFSNCSGLSSINIPNSIIEIGEGAFQGCGMTSIVIPNSITAIGESVFKNCTNLTEITIPSSVISIKKTSFLNTGWYNSQPEGVLYLNVFCLGYKSNQPIGSLDIADGILYICDKAFENCTGLTSVSFPNTLIEIGNNAFSGCSGLTGSLTIPDSVTTICKSAFSNCSGFDGNLTIGNSVNTIAESAFYNCSGFAGSLIIGNSVNEIGACAFQFCSHFTGELIIPNSVVTISNNAFYYCIGFTGNLTIGNSVTTIGNNAFYYCIGFTGNLTIPNSVTTIGTNAFFNCSGFNDNLTIGNSITTIGDGVFQNCSGFTGSLTIPNSVVLIGNSAFSNCSGFTGSLTIGNSVTTIGNNAFNGCSGIASISIPESVVSIGSNAFTNTMWYNRHPLGILYLDNCCIGYKTRKPTGLLSIQDSTRVIANGAFSDCAEVTGTIVIPNTVVTIGSSAFRDCSSFTELTIGEGVTSIGEYAFWNCPQLVTLHFNAINCNTMQTYFYDHYNYYGVFYYTSVFSCNERGDAPAVTTLTIGKNVEKIPNHAFMRFSHVSNPIELSISITTIGSQAFESCSTPDMIIYRTQQPILGSNAFRFTSYSFRVYVPYESLNEYKTAPNWNNYQSKIFPMSYKTISPYNESNDHFRFIASPLVDSIAPITVDNLITETDYDLYRFSPSDSFGEWQNYKAHTDDFKFVNGQGYLYANENEVNIIFKGTFNEDDAKEVNLVYDANDERKCFNLVGNPFPCNAYLDRDYYVLNANGTGINPNAIPATTPIPPCTAVFVKALSEGETVVFTRVAP